jgi:glycosyltransferase involved in cell wall biosynthesis
MKAVFVHPAYPSQFTRIAHALGARPGWECACLVHEGFTEAIRKEAPPIAYYGFREEAGPKPPNDYLQSLDEGIRRGRVVVEALAALKAAGRVDVVIGHATFGTTFFVRDLLQLPVVSYVELPGYFPVYSRPEFPAQYPQQLLDVSLRALVHASVLRSDLGLVPSRHARDLFPPELRDKIRVQMEGFSLPAPPADRAALRRAAGVDGPAPVIGFAGRTLEGVRGFDVFARVAKHIRRSRPDARFLVLGDEATLYGNETAYLGGKSFKQHVIESEAVPPDLLRFKPFMAHEAFVRHLQAMDLVLFPLFEGAANWGLFEAMAAGLPVLASRRCFVPEAIADGENGLLFEPDDVEGFARAALGLLADGAAARRLGARARETVATRFSVERAADGYAEVLREAADRFHGRRPVQAPRKARRAEPAEAVLACAPVG